MNNLVSLLLVDDDEEDYLLTRDIVEQVNHQRYTVDWVDSFGRAREIIARRQHDVYLIDYRLGPDSGLDLIRDAIENGLDKPMILLTGQGDFEVDTQAARAGAADFLVKTHLTADQLERAIRYSMQQAHNLREIRALASELEARVERRTLALRQAVEDLRQSQLLYSSIAANFPNGFISVLDSEYRFVMVDGSELRALSQSLNVAPGAQVQDLVAPEHRPGMEYFLQRIFEGEAVTFEFPIQHNIYTFRGVPLQNLAGQVEQALIVCNNITRQKQAEQDIRKALEKERQLNELKSRFISMASHEFRTPLSTILSSVSLLGRYTEPGSDGRIGKHIDRIRSNVRNLTGILEDFLSISKLEEGKIQAKPEWIDCAELCHEVAEDMQAMAKTGQQIICSADGDSRSYIDPQVLRNILINLLSNAIKYSPENRQVELSLAVDTEQLHLAVRDEGIGIPEEEQKHLFERFFRARNATNIQGTGLGLNIVQRYVALLGGRIEFESRLGEGTVFRVIAPRVAPDAEPVPGLVP
ncbi:MAG: ATP-binding protein [Bacteroidia bacterium]|nr:ATP-binding protein [Bacteroidia bacterium]